ncbi:MAG TPA: delta-60 repeat domain-containing protein [Acidimicrobiales bacterium]|nr:delta-60 repeat domain-containing protein [Acidimicrobiales bacterium]
MSRIRLVVATFLAAFLLLGTIDAASASVSATPDRTAAVNGTVWAVTQVGNRTIIGGDFTTVGGLPRQNAAAILADGSVDPTFAPNPDGIVYAVAGSTDGSRVFLGGVFANAGGVAQSRLAAVDATTGAAVPGWTTGANGDVLALAVNGNRLYAGGRFTTIGAGISRPRLAAVDTTTGAVQTGFNPRPNWTVRALVVSPDGTKVYPVGGFTAVGGQERKLGAAEVLATTGAATTFNPTTGGVALAAELSPDGSRFFFSTTNNRIHAYDPAVSSTPVWVAQSKGDTQAIASSATEVYVGGHFSGFGDRAKRNRIASLSFATGATTAWNPGANGTMGVWAMEVTPTHLLVGGEFTRIGGLVRPGFARFTGTPTP